jgi:hypothetical protein
MRKITGIFLGFIFAIQSLLAGNALRFNGIDEYVQLSEVLNIGSSSSTIETWVRIPVVGDGNLAEDERVGIVIGNWGQGSENVALEVHAAGQVRYYWNNGEYDLKGIKDLRDGSWHHLAAVRDRSNNLIYVYVDGVLEIENPGAGTDINISLTHRIGADNRTSGMPYFHGEIDELRIWNTARTQSQIREFMCEDVSGESGLLAYYRMTDGSGSTLSDNKGSNTGTLVNMDNSNWTGDHLVPNGDGSTTPYQIKSLNHLYWVSTNSSTWNSDFEQVADIDASPTADWNGGAGFSPIGTNANNFLGSYDGAGFTITGLTVDRASENFIGFIGQLDGGPLTDLGLIDVSINGSNSSGGLVGNIESGNVSNCYVSGSVSGTDYVGGLVGQIANGSIVQSFSTASVVGSGQDVGGLIGLLGSSVQNCYARGSVEGNTNAGGLVGSAMGGSTINKSYSTGAVTGVSNAGGLAGYAAEEDPFMEEPGATITASFWDTETSGMNESPGGTGKTTLEMKDQSTFTDAGWDFVYIWGMLSEINNAYPHLLWEEEAIIPVSQSPALGDGSSGNPYEISSLENLYWITENTARWGYHYIQVANIDASETATWFYRAGWKPIGNAITKFTGSYNGQGYRIDNLYCSRYSNSYIGLFGYTDGAAISNVGLTNVQLTGDAHTGGLIGYNNNTEIGACYSTGSVSGTSNIGGLIGYNVNSPVTESHSSGSVTGISSAGGLIGYSSSNSPGDHIIDNCYSSNSVDGTGSLGGLVGTLVGFISDSFNNGDINGSGENVGGLIGAIDGAIFNCYNTGTVSGASFVGGLLGRAVPAVQINTSYNTGSVSGSNEVTYAYVGGLVGRIGAGTIDNCYNSGPVSGAGYYIGGLIGVIGTETFNSYITNSYSAGPVSGTIPSSTGGFTGYKTSGSTISSCYWDVNTDGIDGNASGADNYGATGKTSIEMKMQSTYSGWDFATLWDINTSQNEGYPYLMNNPPDVPLPICLAAFSGLYKKGAVHLKWKTASETENLAFRIYRNGEMIAELEGAGTTTAPQDYQWTDNYVIPGRTYTYVLADVDLQGKETKHPEIEVEIEIEDGTDRDFNIGAAYPNPFNPMTIVPLNLVAAAEVKVILYDTAGRRVRNIYSGQMHVGSHDLKIDGTDLSTGIYFVHIVVHVGAYRSTPQVQKIALMK